MKPESRLFLERAADSIRAADLILTLPIFDAAARNAYLAAFHATQALIFENGNRVIKTHTGVQNELHRLSHTDARIDTRWAVFLSRTYEFKTRADYVVGPTAHVSAEEAIQAVEDAKAFVAHFERVLSEEP